MIERIECRRIVILQPADAFIKGAGIKARELDGISVDEQITELITNCLSTTQQNEKSQSDQPEFVVAETTMEEFLSAAEKALGSINGGTTRDCFKSLTLIVPESEIASDAIDVKTGIRVRNIKKGEIPLPTHPTPDS